MDWPKPFIPEYLPAGSPREYWEGVSKTFEQESLNSLQFYQEDLAELVRLRERHSEDPEIYFLMPALIELATETIFLLKETIEDERKRYRNPA